MTSAPDEGATPPRQLAPPRVVLLWIVVLIAVALGVYAIAPWVLPARVIEGPMVQQSTQTGALLVWFTTRPVECQVTWTVGGETRSAAASRTDRRHVAAVEGLAPGTSCPYQIRAGERVLSGPHMLHTQQPADAAYAFVVLGDSGRGSRAQYDVALQMQRVEPTPDFILHTGDLVYFDGARHRYESRFFAPYRPLLSRVTFWPCLGNHDVDDDQAALPYQEVFELPPNGPEGLPADHNYWFDYASCRVAVLDSNADEGVLRDAIAPWLRAVMGAAGPRWRFVVFHHPPYTGGKYAPDQRLQRTVVPVIDETGVDVVFNGHDHNYQRIGPLRGGVLVEPPAGTWYVITGAGGATLYAAKHPEREYVRALDDDTHSFTHVQVDGDALTLRQIALTGEVLDSCSWTQTGAEPPTSGPAGS